MKKIFIFLIVLSLTLSAQDILHKNTSEYLRSSLSSNSINQIITVGDSAWFALSRGLDLSIDGGRNFINFNSDDYGDKGGIASILHTTDDIIWVGIATDTLIDGSELPLGTGLSYTADGGNSWNYIPQPKDPNVETDDNKYSDSLGYYPTTTRVNNITYDLFQSDNYIWTASFGGGLRRTLWPQNQPEDYKFEVITTNGKPFHAADDLAHVVFSIAGKGKSVAVGSADGVAFTTDEGATWRTSSFDKNDSLSIPANFIVSLGYREEDNSFWAGCIETGYEGERRGLAFTHNMGLSWTHVLRGFWVYSISFFDNIVYASTDEGLYVSYDIGKTWIPTGTISDFQTGEFLATSKVYTTAVQENGNRLWIGTPDGLALRDGNSWRIFRKYSPVGIDGEEMVYAYPNPFFPATRDFVRFQIRANSSGKVSIGIYNFAMEKVIQIEEEISGDPQYPDRSIKWDGKDGSGQPVGNGVYFFRADTPAGLYWGKLVVIK